MGNTKAGKNCGINRRLQKTEQRKMINLVKNLSQNRSLAIDKKMLCNTKNIQIRTFFIIILLNLYQV